MKIMRIVYTTLFVVLIAAIALISKLSPSVIINLTIPNTPNVFNMTLEFYTGFIVLLTGVASIVYFKHFASKGNETEAYKRKCEKVTVQNESYQSKVESLEAKVATLEEALRKTLDNNDSQE